MKEYIEIVCPDYANCILDSDIWNHLPDTDKFPLSPLTEDFIHKLYAEVIGPSGGGSTEGTSDHLDLQEKMRFSYCILLGKLMFSYLSCCPDIAYSVIILSKFFTCPTKVHYGYLQGVVQYLYRNKIWGIRFHCNCSNQDFYPDLPHGDFKDLLSPSIFSIHQFIRFNLLC